MTNIFALSILIAILSLNASTGADIPKVYGFRGGASLGNMFGEDVIDANTNPIFGITGGGFVIFEISDQFLLQAELLLSQKGVKRIYTVPALNGTIDITETTKITGLELPVIAKFPFPKQKSILPSIYLGSSLSTTISANSKGEYNPIGFTSLPSGSFDNKVENVRTFNFEMVIGADFTFDLSNSSFVIDLRYSVSPFGMFTNIDELNEVSSDKYYIADLNTGKALELKSEAITVSLGVLFTK